MTALYLESPPDAALDVALSHALLRAGTEAVRLWTPPPALSFGRLDLLSPGAERAISGARKAGLTPVRRLAGGRAAAIGPWTVCVGAAYPGPQAPELTQRRYESFSAVLLAALRSLGVDARVGELDGEWCPGSWSVLAGSSKVAGLAQRVIRVGAWVEAVLVVDVPQAARKALDEVQRELGVPWNPATFAGLRGVSSGQLIAALRESVASHWELDEAELAPELWHLARSLRGEHVICS